MAYLSLILATMFWGGNYVVGKLMVAHASPVMMASFRWFFAFLFLIIIHYKKVIRDWSEIRKSLFNLSFLAFFGQVMFPLALYIGLQYTTPINAAIYLATTPCLVLTINKLFFKDHISLNNMLGVILSMIGVVIVIFHGKLDLNEIKFNVGDIWAFGSALSWSIYCSCIRFKNKKISGNSFVTVSAGIGTIILLIISLFNLSLYNVEAFSHINILVIVGFVYLVIFPSWLSYYFWGKGIGKIGATKGEIYTHLIPLFATVFSVLFLDNRIHFYMVIAFIFIAVGVYLCSKHEHFSIRKLFSKNKLKSMS